MVKRFLMCVALVAISFSVSAAKPQALPMPLGEQLPVELVVAQQQLMVEVADNTGLAIAIGPLIPGVIDSISRNRAMERVTPLQQALASYRFNERFETELRSRLVSEGISPAPRLEVLSMRREQAGGPLGDAPTYALVIWPRYMMTQDFDRMYVQIIVTLMDRTPKGADRFKSKARAARIYRFSHLLDDGRTSDNVAAWHSLPPEVLSSLLDDSIRHVIDMMVYDFSAEGRAGWDANVRLGRARHNGRLYGGLEVRRGDEWIWLRSGAPAVRIQQQWVVNAAPFKMGINGFRVIDPVELVKPATPEPAATQATEQAPSADAVPEQP